MKQITILLASALTLVLSLAACDNEMETIDRRTVGPEAQAPALYAEYLKALSAYKASDHFLTYARMENAPEVSTSPRDYLHAMPDSLDYIALMRPLSPFDCEDLPGVRAKGTKILLCADCSVAATAAQAVEDALAQVAAHGLDGLTIYGGSTAPDAALFDKAARAGTFLVFEGDPALVSPESREKIDLYVRDVTGVNNVFTLQTEVDYMLERVGIPAAKLLLATTPDSRMDDAALQAQEALTLVARAVMTYGPLAGLAVYDIGKDYYDPSTNYRRTKAAINLLNPAYN